MIKKFENFINENKNNIPKEKLIADLLMYVVGYVVSTENELSDTKFGALSSVIDIDKIGDKFNIKTESGESYPLKKIILGAKENEEDKDKHSLCTYIFVDNSPKEYEEYGIPVEKISNLKEFVEYMEKITSKKMNTFFGRK